MREDVVERARGWIGTPYRHQASVRGAGADCLGLVRGIWRECLGAEPEVPPPYAMDWDEVAKEERLWSAAKRYLHPVHKDAMVPGDVILFRMREGCVAKHLGILSGRDHFVHAYERHGVIESSLTEPWRRRIAACFRFPKEIR